MSLHRIVQDIQSRRNIDIYVTLFVAIGTSVLSFFSDVPAELMSALTTTVLALLAFTVLATRDAVENLRLGHGDPEFFDDYPQDLRSRREKSFDLYLIGVSLSRTLESSYGALQTNLSRGARLRVLLTSPEADDAAIDARSLLTKPRIEDMRKEIRESLRILAELQRVANGRLEVRTTRACLHFGLNYLDVDKADSMLCVQTYSYRLPGESRPIFALQRIHGQWFECYRHQAEVLWDDANAYVAGETENL